MKSAKWTDLRVLQWSLILQLISFSFVFISTCTANRKADQAKIDRQSLFFINISLVFVSLHLPPLSLLLSRAKGFSKRVDLVEVIFHRSRPVRKSEIKLVYNRQKNMNFFHLCHDIYTVALS